MDRQAELLGSRERAVLLKEHEVWTMHSLDLIRFDTPHISMPQATEAIMLS